MAYFSGKIFSATLLFPILNISKKPSNIVIFENMFLFRVISFKRRERFKKKLNTVNRNLKVFKFD